MKINGKRVKAADYILFEGDTVELYISDEFFPDKNNFDNAFQNLSGLKSEEICYEDSNIIVIDKKSGETVHSNLTDEEKSDSNESFLIDRALKYLFDKGEYNPLSEQSFTPALCNRLDRNTSGLLIMAKNAESLRIMNNIIKNRLVKKTYLCEVQGIPSKKQAILKDYLYKDRTKNRVFVFSSPQEAKNFPGVKYHDDIKTIITKYTVLKSLNNTSLLQVELVTGRTHQIRAHLAYIGFPIVGDAKYGVCHKKNMFQQLCSYSLKFELEQDCGILNYLNGMELYSKRADFSVKYSL